MKLHSLTFALSALIFISCKDQGNVVNKMKDKYKNNYVFVHTGIKEFVLDDETSYLLTYIQHIDKDTGPSVLFVNEFNNSVYFYDYETTNFIRKIDYDKEGSNGVHNIQGILYLNEDSIFVYSYNIHTLFLTNSKSKVLNKYKIYEIPDDISIIYPASYVQTGTPIKRFGKKIVLFGFVSGETSHETLDNRPTCTMVDLENNSISYLINYPEQYSQFNWGGGFVYRLPYYDVDDTSIIVSFPADHNVIKYSLEGSQNKFYAGSSSISKISSFPQDKDMPIDSDKEWNWYMENPSYQNVLYDKYQNLYYRIARLPVKDYEPTAIGNKKTIVIIALDSQLNYLGEATLPDHIQWQSTNCFVSKDGFNIQVITDDEDKLTFHQYKFKENEN